MTDPFRNSSMLSNHTAMTPEQYENLRKLTKKYKISFDGPLSREQWPPTHARLFQNIQSLGQMRYHEYKADTTKRSLNEPWVAQSTRRAERVVARAKRLRSENRNEAGWRLELEPEIFSRFTIEVAWCSDPNISSAVNHLLNLREVRTAEPGYGDLKLKHSSTQMTVPNRLLKIAARDVSGVVVQLKANNRICECCPFAFIIEETDLMKDLSAAIQASILYFRTAPKKSSSMMILSSQPYPRRSIPTVFTASARRTPSKELCLT